MGAPAGWLAAPAGCAAYRLLMLLLMLLLLARVLQSLDLLDCHSPAAAAFIPNSQHVPLPQTPR